MQIADALRFSSLTVTPDKSAMIEFDLIGANKTVIAQWTIKVLAQNSADACIDYAREQILKQMRYVISLADA